MCRHHTPAYPAYLTGHPVTALSTLAVSAASARRRPTSMLCSIQHMTGGPEVGGLWGGGGGSTYLVLHADR